MPLRSIRRRVFIFLLLLLFLLFLFLLVDFHFGSASLKVSAPRASPRALQRSIQQAEHRDRDRDPDRDLDQDQDLNPDRDRDPDQDLNPDRDRDRDQDQDQDQDQDLNPDRDRDLDLDRDSDQDPNPDRDQDLNPDPDRDQDSERDRDLNPDQDLNPDRDLNQDQDPNPDRDLDQDQDPDLNPDRDSDQDLNPDRDSGLRVPHVSRPKLRLADVFVAVKTTRRFHRTRLDLLLETWISRTRTHTFIFTDSEDERLEGYNVAVTSCPSDHSQTALSCKMAAEYDAFMASDKSWLCHVDDDNYVNPLALVSLLSSFPQNGDVYVGRPSLDTPITAHELLPGNATREVRFWFATGGAGFCLSRRLAEKMRPWTSGPRFSQTSSRIRLPDDCTVGFIVETKLRVSMTHCPLFHSHLENLQLVSPRSVPHQVTLSYGMLENKMNIIEVNGFSKEDDPTRFKSVHCILFPFTSWCP